MDLIAELLTLLVGFAVLALSQDRNWRQVHTTPAPSRKAPLRAIGFALLGLGLVLAVWRDGPGFGPLLWGTLLSVAAGAVTVILSLRPVLLRALARMADVALVAGSSASSLNSPSQAGAPQAGPAGISDAAGRQQP